MTEENTIQVWDPLVRLFHWSLAVCVTTAWMTPEVFIRLHVVSGFVVLGLILFRLGWGFWGTSYALFRDFVHAPGHVVAYLRDVAFGHPARFIGHNPAGGIMVVLLMTMTTATAVLGLVAYGAGEFSGPFAELGNLLGSREVAWLKETHEWLANGVLLLVTIHLSGVVLTSWQHRENLILSMVTGKKIR